MTTVHGTCLVVATTGLLLRGPSGSGKSDLALRAIHEGSARLVADDQVLLERTADGGLRGSAPAILAGRIEVRGIGILAIDHAGPWRIDALVDLVPRDDVERLPLPEYAELMGVVLPRYHLHAFDASAPARLSLIARCCGANNHGDSGNGP